MGRKVISKNQVSYSKVSKGCFGRDWLWWWFRIRLHRKKKYNGNWRHVKRDSNEHYTQHNVPDVYFSADFSVVCRYNLPAKEPPNTMFVPKMHSLQLCCRLGLIAIHTAVFMLTLVSFGEKLAGLERDLDEGSWRAWREGQTKGAGWSGEKVGRSSLVLLHTAPHLDAQPGCIDKVQYSNEGLFYRSVLVL